ncbi:hypothetical protein BGZ60DRAFT_485151 [Tricladium varicosporioides]|nr:hypothetical protein BGZ60DRAFT_485151 [Hymenoscyphus varicosporioides]
MPNGFITHHPTFKNIIGENPVLGLLREERDGAAMWHEAGVYFENSDGTAELWITSNLLPSADGTGGKRVDISRVTLSKMSKKLEGVSVAVPMGNGGVNYVLNGKEGVLFCGQGSGEGNESGLYFVERARRSNGDHRVELVIGGFYGRKFNSVNDVVIHSDGSIWFTDPTYGYDQSYRPKPELPQQVYRFDPADKSIRAVADGFGRPNGICFSPDEKTVYITDTDGVHGGSPIYHPERSSCIYAFDIIQRAEQPFLVNRRLFAQAINGIPDGIKCDMKGNVYSGCGDGVEVWNEGGVLLGVVAVEGGAANFCFGKGGAMYILNENKIWGAQLGEDVKGALLRI